MDYTRGEWGIEEDNLGCKNIVAKNQTIFSCEKIGYTTGLSIERQDRANALLIASAPNMYDALKAWDNYASANYPKNMTLKRIAWELTEKAIAKAEGRKP